MRNRFVVVALLVVAAAYIVIAANPPGATPGPDSANPAQPVAQPAAEPGQGGAALADSGAKKQYDKPGDMKIDPNKKYMATIDTDAGTMVAELYPKIAPKTVNSFVFLAKEGFYDGLIFHRVIPGFMIQGGDPTGTGMGGPGYSVPAEFNETKHDRGILSMARSSDPNSAGSQFFVMHARSPHLDGSYTAFGKVTEGLETIDKIVNAPRGESDRPNNPVKIKTIKIEEK
jgi:peptidyl-prolyl cis-trans isomerase B (cyclophilin B)